MNINKKNEPLVSAIIPTRNSASTLDACLQSIRGQSYKNIEIIVVDNNSTDDSKEIARKYTNLVFNKGPERSTQRNFGSKKSKGQYLLFIDSDMELSSEVVKECVFLSQESGIENQKLGGIIVPEKSIGIGFWAKCKALEKSFYVGVEWIEAARFFTKKNFVEVGGYDEKLTSGEDWDLHQKVKANFSILRIKSFIKHNEGKLSLLQTLKKKMYYAARIKNYSSKKMNNKSFKEQSNIFKRYELFFSNPVRLFKNPLLGIGMLFMKTCEFGFGGLGLLLKNEKYT